MTERQERVQALRRHHESLFERLRIPDAYFDSKVFMMIDGEKMIGFYDSQLNPGVPVYFELNGFKQEINDPTRTLYVLKPDPKYKENYVFVADGKAGPQYFTPLKDIPVVPKDSKWMAPSEKVIIESTEVDPEDATFQSLTARDHACISLKVPSTKKEWLNKLITESLKQKYGDGTLRYPG